MIWVPRGARTEREPDITTSINNEIPFPADYTPEGEKMAIIYFRNEYFCYYLLSPSTNILSSVPIKPLESTPNDLFHLLSEQNLSRETYNFIGLSLISADDR